MSLGLRVLTSLEYVVREALAETGEVLTGLYAGNPKLSASKPTAELLLAAYMNVTLLLIPQNGHHIRYLNTLTGLQERIMKLFGCSAKAYTKLASSSEIYLEK